MKRRYRAASAGAALAMLAALSVPTTSAVAGHNGDLTVQVGQFFGVGPKCDQETGRGCRGAESMRYLAPTLTVHKGDVITFDIQGFHTATMLPRPSDFFDWTLKNAGGVGKPWSIWGSDPDDTSKDEGGSTSTPSLKMKNLLPSEQGCGDSPSNPCSYDGTEILNSGVPLMPGQSPTFSVRIDADPDPNTPIWTLCLVHPHMFIRIFVVPDSTATTTQAQIDADKAGKVAQDVEWATATDARLINTRRSHVTPDGKRVFDVYAGKDNHWASLLAFYPKKLTLKKGQTARFHFTDNIYEVHTASFPFSTALAVFNQTFFPPQCDPDGDSGSADDEPAEGDNPCDGDFSKLEFDVPPLAFYPAGDGSFGGSDYESSGVRGATPLGAATRNDPWDLRFTKTNEKGFRYFCIVHSPFMGGKVVVK